MTAVSFIDRGTPHEIGGNPYCRQAADYRPTGKNAEISELLGF